MKKEPDWHAIHFNQRDRWESVAPTDTRVIWTDSERARIRPLLERCEKLLTSEQWSRAHDEDFQPACPVCMGTMSHKDDCAWYTLVEDLREELGR